MTDWTDDQYVVVGKNEQLHRTLFHGSTLLFAVYESKRLEVSIFDLLYEIAAQDDNNMLTPRYLSCHFLTLCLFGYIDDNNATTAD